jgi:hypothetical protein
MERVLDAHLFSRDHLRPTKQQNESEEEAVQEND